MCIFVYIWIVRLEMVAKLMMWLCSTYLLLHFQKAAKAPRQVSSSSWFQKAYTLWPQISHVHNGQVAGIWPTLKDDEVFQCFRF